MNEFHLTRVDVEGDGFTLMNAWSAQADYELRKQRVRKLMIEKLGELQNEMMREQDNQIRDLGIFQINANREKWDLVRYATMRPVKMAMPTIMTSLF